MAQQCKLPTVIPEGLKTATKGISIAAAPAPAPAIKGVLSAAPEQATASAPLCVVCGVPTQTTQVLAPPQATLVPSQSSCISVAQAAAPTLAQAPATLTLSIPTCGGGTACVPVSLKLVQPAATCVAAAPTLTYVTAAPAEATAAAPTSCCLCG